MLLLPAGTWRALKQPKHAARWVGNFLTSCCLSALAQVHPGLGAVLAVFPGLTHLVPRDLSYRRLSQTNKPGFGGFLLNIGLWGGNILLNAREWAKLALEERLLYTGMGNDGTGLKSGQKLSICRVVKRSGDQTSVEGVVHIVRD